MYSLDLKYTRTLGDLVFRCGGTRRIGAGGIRVWYEEACHVVRATWKPSHNGKARINGQSPNMPAKNQLPAYKVEEKDKGPWAPASGFIML